MPPDDTSKTFTPARLQEAANAFIQTHGKNQESSWRWEHTEMLNQFIAGLFAEKSPPPVVDWQAAQALRWKALNRLGWHGEEPRCAQKPGEVGIRMVQAGTGAWTEFVLTTGSMSFEAIHTTLLEAAERFVSGAPPRRAEPAANS